MEEQSLDDGVDEAATSPSSDDAFDDGGLVGLLDAGVPDVFGGDSGRSLRVRRRELRRRLEGVRVDLEKDLEASDVPREDVEAILRDVDDVVAVLESDAGVRDYVEALERSRDAVDRLSTQTGYLGASLGVAGLLLRLRVTAKLAAAPVAAYLLYLVFRNINTLRTALMDGRHVVAARLPSDAVPPDVEPIPFGEVRHAEAVDRAVEKAARVDADTAWTSKAIDLGGAKDMDEVERTFTPYETAADGSYYVRHERGVVAVEVVGERDEATEIEVE